MYRQLLQKMLDWKHQRSRKPLLLKGARQVGKTYLLQAFGQLYFPKVHYFNFEKQANLGVFFEHNLEPKRIIRELSFHQDIAIDIDKDLVIFDEIQACPNALTSLKYFNEDMPNLALCAAGSLLGVYLGPVSFPVGKVDMLEMYPLSFEEFLMAIDEKRSIEAMINMTESKSISKPIHQHLWTCLKQYFVVGGLPEVVTEFVKYKDNLFNAMQAVRNKQEQLINMYIADMAKHAGQVNAMHIERVFKSVPAQLSATRDGSVAKYKFTGVLPGVSRYTRLVGPIDWLNAAGLIIKVPIINTGHQPLLAHAKETQFKLYLFDIGLLGAMCDLAPKVLLDYSFGSYKGFLAENYVAQAFIQTGARHLLGYEKERIEVEFVMEINGNVIPIEVKSGWVTRAKSIKLFAEKYQSPYRVIFSAHPLLIDDINKIHRYPLYLVSQFPLEIT